MKNNGSLTTSPNPQDILKALEDRVAIDTSRKLRDGYKAEMVRTARLGAIEHLLTEKITEMDMNNKTVDELHRVLACNYMSAGYVGVENAGKPKGGKHDDGTRYAHKYAYEDINDILFAIRQAKRNVPAPTETFAQSEAPSNGYANGHAQKKGDPEGELVGGPTR